MSERDDTSGHRGDGAQGNGGARDVSDGTSGSAEHPDTVERSGTEDGADDGGGRDATEGGDHSDETTVSSVERAVMVVAFAFTVGLFTFALWQAVAGAEAVEPTANVTGVQSAGENVTYYGVTLQNEGDAGLVTATVSVECPRPTRQVTFENVPAKAHRNATVGCPNGSSPTAEVVSWIGA